MNAVGEYWTFQEVFRFMKQGVRFVRLSIGMLGLFLGVVARANAQAAGDLQSQLQARFADHFIFFKHWYAADVQRYGQNGVLEHARREGEWVRYGVMRVNRVKLDSEFVTFEGSRMLVVQVPYDGMKSDGGRVPKHPALVASPERVTVIMKLDPDRSTEQSVETAWRSIQATTGELKKSIPYLLSDELDCLLANDWSAPAPLASDAIKTGAEPRLVLQDGTPVFAVSPRGGRVKAPVPIKVTDPEYPEVEKLRHVQGSVDIEALIDRNGVPTSLHLLGAASPGFESKALESVRQWRFKPALRDGSPVVVESQIEVKFYDDGPMPVVSSVDIMYRLY